MVVTISLAQSWGASTRLLGNHMRQEEVNYLWSGRLVTQREFGVLVDVMRGGIRSDELLAFHGIFPVHELVHRGLLRWLDENRDVIGLV